LGHQKFPVFAMQKTANAIKQVAPYSTVKQPAAQSQVKCQGRTIQKKTKHICSFMYPLHFIPASAIFAVAVNKGLH
jgi:hypothetical protein